MWDRWIDRLNQEVEELLVESHKVHKEALESTNDMTTYAEILWKQEEEYREHVRKLKEINKLPQQTLLEQSILEEGNEDFINKTINIMKFWTSFIFSHKNEVEQVGKDLTDQIVDLEAIIAMMVN